MKATALGGLEAKMRNLAIGAIALWAGMMVGAPSASSAEVARLAGGEQVLKVGETAEFKIASSAASSSELHAWCEVAAGGNATLMFDGDHYIPLSEPTVGDVISLSGGETRRYDLEGTVEANKGDAYIAFAFTGSPTAMCFPGMKCDGAAAGAQEVKVVCNNNK